MPNIIQQIIKNNGDGQTIKVIENPDEQSIKMIGNIKGEQAIKIVVCDNERGPQGEKGDTGEAATIVAGQAYSVPSTDAPAVENVGTSTNAVFDFYIPKGEKGAKGDTGAQGPRGEKGDTGAKGDKGDKGDQGLRGPEGPQGIQGPRGERGLQGPIGDRGPIGPVGPQGPQGIQGATGAQGPKGATGATGPAGKDGKDGKDGAIQYTAGSGIVISSNNVISATGGGGGGDAIWGGITGVIADQTDLQNEFSLYTKTTDLASVATSGDYGDLKNKPTIPAAQVNSDWNAASGVAQILNKPSLATVATSGLYSDLTGTPSLATVATSGSYNDLSNKPTIPAAQVNSDWNSASGVSQILNKPSLATVATSGSYNDLSNKPSIPAAQVQSDWTQADNTKVDYIKNKPSLATVATSGSYSDLTNKPTIPAAQVNSDWNAASGVAQILNKPTIPTVNNATLTITQDGTSLATFTANSSTDTTAAIVSPVQIGSTLSSSTSEFVNTANIVDGAVTASKLAIGSIIDLFYPVGSYYETSNTSFNPNVTWGGTWVEDSAGLVTVAKDTNTFATVGDTGGEETHTLTVSEMPSHIHNMDRPRWWGNDSTIGDSGAIYNQTTTTTAMGENIAGQGVRHAVGSTGGDLAHNNLQPYVVIKRWHRTA